MRRPSHRPRRRPQSKRINYGHQTKPRLATRVPHRIARHGYRTRLPSYQGDDTPGGTETRGGIANAAMGPIDRGARIRSNFGIPSQESSGYVAQHSPTVAAPSKPPEVEGRNTASQAQPRMATRVPHQSDIHGYRLRGLPNRKTRARSSRQTPMARIAEPATIASDRAACIRARGEIAPFGAIGLRLIPPKDAPNAASPPSPAIAAGK